MAPAQEDTAINRLIKKHLLNEPALLKVAAILGVHPAGDATPETVKAILPQRDIPWKQLLYGTPLQRKMAVESLRTHYGFKALEMLEKAYSLNTASPEQISNARISVSGSIEAAFTTITKATRPTKKEKTHRQPRELLKTLASNIGKGPDLFSRETFLDDDIPIIKDTLSKSAGILALELIKDMQAKGTTRGEIMELEINNLSEYARRLGEQPEDIKKSLQHLGGFIYGLTYVDENTKELVITANLLFNVEFRYSAEALQEKTITKYGTKLSSFIIGEPVDRVIVKLNKRIAASLAAKKPLGLGGILVTDTFITSQKNLTDMAAKILNYTATNHPSQGIAWSKLYRHLGLEKQAKKQGRPRLQKRILEALEELKTLGHLKAYESTETTLHLQYTSALVKHPDHSRSQTATEPGPEEK
jgi:hypothetical protein